MANPISAGELLQYPFDQWSPQTLITRTGDRSISFQTTMHRSLIAAFLINNQEKIQNVFSQTIEPVIVIQNRVRDDLDNKRVSKIDNLKNEDVEVVVKNISAYINELGQAEWVLPIEGFIDMSMVPEGFALPNCLGPFKMNL